MRSRKLKVLIFLRHNDIWPITITMQISENNFGDILGNKGPREGRYVTLSSQCLGELVIIERKMYRITDPD